MNAVIKLFNHDLLGTANVYLKRSQEKKINIASGRLGSTLNVGVHRAAELQGNSWIENKMQQRAVGLF